MKPECAFIEYTEDGNKSRVAFWGDDIAKINESAQAENIVSTISDNNELDNLKDKIQDLESQISQLKAEKNNQVKLVESLQSMLSSTLKFSERVRNSRVGKIFFRKQIRELDTSSQDDRDISK